MGKETGERNGMHVQSVDRALLLLIFLANVDGQGNYLPAYSFNPDIMNYASAAAAERIAKRLLKPD